MGVAYVAWIYDDSIRGATPSPGLWTQLKYQLGEALLKLCLRPDVAFDDRTMQKERVTFHSVGHSANGANLCDQVHSSEERAFLWAGNRLQTLRQLSNEGLETLAGLVLAEQEARRKRSL